MTHGTAGIPERLKASIRRWHGSDTGERAFARAMKERGEQEGAEVRGVSRAMIQRYLAGDAVPPVDFLIEAADLLGVRFEWLASGQGLSTNQEAMEVGRSSDILRQRVLYIQEVVRTRLETEIPELSGLLSHHWGWNQVLTFFQSMDIVHHPWAPFETREGDKDSITRILNEVLDQVVGPLNWVRASLRRRTDDGLIPLDIHPHIARAYLDSMIVTLGMFIFPFADEREREGYDTYLERWNAEHGITAEWDTRFGVEPLPPKWSVEARSETGHSDES